jgi:hypothetical protein
MGRIDDAKAHALIPIGVYYCLYHDKEGDKREIDAIEEAAKEYPEIAAKIAKK